MQTFLIAVVLWLVSIPAVVAETIDLIHPNTTNPKRDNYDDWVCCKASNHYNLCDGYYLEPTVLFPGQSTATLNNDPIIISADQGSFLAEGNNILSGNIQLNQGNRRVLADRAFIHRNKAKAEIDNIKAFGNVRLTEPGIRLEGDSAELNIENDTQYLENVTYRLYSRHARGEAQSLFIRNRCEILLHKASYTTCAPYQNTWMLKSTKIKLNKITGRGKSYHTRLYVTDIPIFYFPYLDFPIDDRRQTGFLYPTMETTKQSGFVLSTPFYWNMAENYDATLTPRYLSKRGAELQGLFRYLTPRSVGEIDGSILPNDTAYRKFQQKYLADHVPLAHQDPRVTGLQKATPRSALRAINRTTLNPNLGFNLQYATVSDDNYFMDFGNSIGVAATTQLLQQADIGYYDRNWNGLLRLQRYQTLHPYKGPVTNAVYQKLPQFAFKNEYTDFCSNFSFMSTGDFTHFYQPKNHTTRTRLTIGDRFQYRLSITHPIITPSWYVKPRFQLDCLGYRLQLDQAAKFLSQSRNPSRLIPLFDMDTGLIFERPIYFNNLNYLQTLEPRTYYLYVPYHNQNSLPNFDTSTMGFDFNQLYRDNRFIGLDRIGDTHQITLGLTTRLLEEINGQEKIMLTIGQIFYFKNRQVTVYKSELANLTPSFIIEDAKIRRQKMSPIAGQAVYHLQNAWTVTARQEWDFYKTHANKSMLGVEYHPYPLNVFNLSYIFINKNFARIHPLTGNPERLNQIDSSLAWEMTDNWRILGRWRYDIYKKRNIEELLGIEHQGCCTAVRLTFNRFLNLNDTLIPSAKSYQNGLFLQFVFKGLTSVGHNKMGNYLKQAIPNYEWHGENF